MLFRIAFMVDEKKLGSTLATIHKLKVVNMETPAPVVIADDRPYHELFDFGDRKVVQRKEISAMLEQLGKPADAITYAVQQLIKHGKLRPNGERGRFIVVGANKSTPAKKRKM